MLKKRKVVSERKVVSGKGGEKWGREKVVSGKRVISETERLIKWKTMAKSKDKRRQTV